MPSRERYLFVCTNRRPDGHPKGSCAERGSEALLDGLKGELLRRKLVGQFRVCGTTCLDACEQGAAVLLEPDHIIFERVGLEAVSALVDRLVAGEPAKRADAPGRG